ncbi:MAG: endonuclease III, partial [Nitrospinota bacterium]|nr:endonuclease III [Nitrospinota bacterium]
LQSIIKPVGLSPTKSKNIISTCKILIKKYQGNIPNKREELEYLPGVGRKTANVILNEGFGYPTIAVDTHVFRVSNRTGLALGKNVLDTEKELLRVTPEKWAKNAHHYLILHGRYVCKARKFDCKQCVINKECEYTEKN